MQKLETNRLIIRDFTPEDVWDLHEILGDPEVMKYCEPAYDLESVQERYAQDNEGNWADLYSYGVKRD